MTGQYESSDEQVDVYDVTSLGKHLKLTSERKVELTHEFAQQLLEMPEFQADRPLRQGHVDYLVGTMTRGTFHPEDVLLKTCILDGTEYRINGQHTCWARLEMPSKWRCPVRHQRYKADSMEDMRILYASVDRIAPRTKVHVINAYLVGTDEYSGVKYQTIKVLPSAVTLWKWERQNDRLMHDGDDVAYLMRTELAETCGRVAAFIDLHDDTAWVHCRRAPVVAAMLETFDKFSRVAVEFWEAVISGIGIENAGDPRLKLRTLLIKAKLNTQQGSMRQMRNVIGREQMYRICLHAWNAWRRGSTQRTFRAGNSRPKIV